MEKIKKLLKERINEKRVKKAKAPFDYLSSIDRLVLHRIGAPEVLDEELYKSVRYSKLESKEEFKETIKLLAYLGLIKSEKREGKNYLRFNMDLYDRKGDARSQVNYKIYYTVSDPITGKPYPKFKHV